MHVACGSSWQRCGAGALSLAGALALGTVQTSPGAPRPAGPVIDNRPARADEWGYRPPDGAAVCLNPPSLTWVHAEGAQAYTVQWARAPGFEDAETAEGVRWPTYTHHRALPAGRYHWRYRAASHAGTTSAWSRVRSFVVPADAAEFPMPTAAQQQQRVPPGHPRLFMRPEDLPRLRTLARGREATRFAALRAEADRVLRDGPTPEPEHLGSARDKENAELVKYWWPNRVQTERACKEAELLAFVYVLSGDGKYGDAARRWVLHLASWDPDGPTQFRLNCEAAKPMLFRPARAYDWAWDRFTAEDRARVHAITQRRVQDAWVSGEVQRGSGHLSRPYNSHGNRIWHKIGEAGLAFLGEIPEAATWLDYAVNKFYACYPVWSDDDGGWHEGVSYWAGYMGKAVWWLQAAEAAIGIDGTRKPFFAQVGDYPLYIAPPGSPNMGFGDLSYRTPPASIGAFMEYHIRMKRRHSDGAQAGYWRWWTEQWRMKGDSGIHGFLYAANLPAMPPAKAPADLPVSKVFRGIGVASLHTTLLDARDDVHVLFKSSPFGTRSHGHNPHNTFQLNAYGEPLLTTCVYRDLHGSKFHYQWAHSTLAHNGVLVNGTGQIPHTAAPHGRIVASRFTPESDYVVGDATDAYGGRLTCYRRHVALVQGAVPFVVLCDELEARDPSTFQFLLHALEPFTVDEPTAQLAVARPHAGVRVQYLTPTPLAFRQWNGYQPAPRKPMPNQWHVEAGTRTALRQLDMITVLVPHRAGHQPEWRAERLATPDTIDARVHIAGKSLRLRFPRRNTPHTFAVAAD
ncbi:MAG: DUF4962 domain-containing protein [Verrucomicrobia bacterium]|nr:DUF4962 domain-containing protein [Verrucomicrobiota bacterium]